ncbi:3628_t:CDS:2, partial [Rhizophagus irregularis]
PENLEDENKLDDETEMEKRLEQLRNLIKVLEIEMSVSKNTGTCIGVGSFKIYFEEMR